MHLLDAPWPDNLDLATGPFKKRTCTVLRRMGYFDDPSQFDALTEADALSWWNAGPVTVADIRTTGNDAIRRYGNSLVGLQPIKAYEVPPVDHCHCTHRYRRGL